MNLYLSIIGPDVRRHEFFVELDALEQLPKGRLNLMLDSPVMDLNPYESSMSWIETWFLDGFEIVVDPFQRMAEKAKLWILTQLDKGTTNCPSSR